jgi:hypothetical protein
MRTLRTHKPRRITLARVRRAADRLGATCEPSPAGRYVLVAPSGRFWLATGTRVVVVPLAHADPAERRCLLRWAYTCCRDGLAE